MVEEPSTTRALETSLRHSLLSVCYVSAGLASPAVTLCVCLCVCVCVCVFEKESVCLCAQMRVCVWKVKGASVIAGDWDVRYEDQIIKNTAHYEDQKWGPK